VWTSEGGEVKVYAVDYDVGTGEEDGVDEGGRGEKGGKEGGGRMEAHSGRRGGRHQAAVVF